ncbi:ABC transporter substrate-binding protein [Leadbettera azotonutricia]|uniref:sn-glycerol-3-phosphate-binding periplasmic protein UgpB n=1 Tax=Leadbettera azotonutricia (strain ATCC BAA-888 / DSM 13862 / ZAS-9) TaxID=545695 RepID=F5YF20_LEAAZ|nr:sugar ABC transporter substrate-binding protein [Leadbettera azotonutricia]AEF81877.1 putative sugar ABC transporter, sugar-binding protein [Leadbettera azotonutricia ZAS-9]
MKARKTEWALAVLFMLLVTAFFASGCKGKDSAAASSSAAGSGGTTITYLMWGEPTRTGSMQRLADAFHQKYPNVTVDIDNAGDNFGVKFNTLVAAGTPPDAALVNELFGAGLYSNGFYENIYSNIQNDKDFLNNTYNKIADPVKSPFTMSANEVFALPTMNYVTLLFYNKDMFDAAGLSYPDESWDWNTFRENAKKLTIRQGNNTTQYGTFFTRLIVYEQSWFFSNGVEIISQDRSHTDIGTPAGIESFKTMQAIIHTDKSAPIPDTTGGAQVSNISFDTGKVAMQLFGAWMIPPYATLPFNWGVSSVPKGPKGIVPAAFPNGMGVGKGSKNNSAAFDWVKFCTTEEGQLIIAEEGLAQPTLESVMNSPAFANASKQADMNIVKRELLRSQGPNAVARWAAIGGDNDSYINSALDRIMIYNENVDSVIKEIVPGIDKILSEVSQGKVN